MSRRRGESRFLASRSGCSVKKNRRDSNDEGSVDRHLARASELVHESQEDEGEGTSLTDRGASARRNTSFQDDEPLPAPSPVSDAGEGQNGLWLCHPQICRTPGLGDVCPPLLTMYAERTIMTAW